MIIKRPGFDPGAFWWTSTLEVVWEAGHFLSTGRYTWNGVQLRA